MPDRYDLHTHSVHSDGTTSATEIAEGAAKAGLAGFALTDHDTIDGWQEARDAARAAGIDFIPGIELTTQHGGRSRHLLAYGIDPEAGELFSALSEVRRFRRERAREMVRRVSVDYAIDWQKIVGEHETRTVGRPHIADALVDAGYFPDRTAAFEQVLHPGSPYYLGTYAIDTVEAIGLVRAAGGAAVLAHPAAFRQRMPTSTGELREFAQAGLFGVELDHPENRGDWLPPLERATRELGLQRTGASDFHGAGKPNRLGERTTGADVIARMREEFAR